MFALLLLCPEPISCRQACGNFREMASEFCECSPQSRCCCAGDVCTDESTQLRCGPSLECHILGTCLPKCGLEARVINNQWRSRLGSLIFFWGWWFSLYSLLIFCDCYLRCMCKYNIPHTHTYTITIYIYIYT